VTYTIKPSDIYSRFELVLRAVGNSFKISGFRPPKSGELFVNPEGSIESCKPDYKCCPRFIVEHIDNRLSEWWE
jgi:hypothetical protein